MSVEERAVAFCDSTGNLFDDDHVLKSFQLFTDKANTGVLQKAHFVEVFSMLFEDPESEDVWVILNNQDFLNRFFYFCSGNEESLNFDEYCKGLLEMFGGEDLKDFRFKVWDVDHTNELSKGNMSDMLHSMLITFVRCKLRSNKCDEEKKKKILEHVENVASRRIVGAWIDKTYAKYADNEEKNSISYAAYCKAFEVDEDSFDWNDVAVELMEQLEEEISAI